MGEAEHEIREEFVEANGLRFRVLACGEGERQALLLHGFPESAETWRRQLQLLAGLGYCAWAPDMRGYGGSERPEGVEAYALERLLEDVRGLIEASGAERVLLVGHDWGGIVSWYFGVRHPELVERLIQMNIPHPACFRANYSPRQALRSLYALVFQIPRLPEWLIARQRVSQMIERSAGHPENHDPVALEAFDRNVRQPGTSTAMFNYYRALVRGGGMRRQHKLGYPPIPLPVLLLWGEPDIALGKQLTIGTSNYAPNLVLRFLPGTSHWLQQDAPAPVGRMITQWLAGDLVEHASGAVGDIG